MYNHEQFFSIYYIIRQWSDNDSLSVSDILIDCIIGTVIIAYVIEGGYLKKNYLKYLYANKTLPRNILFKIFLKKFNHILIIMNHNLI